MSYILLHSFYVVYKDEATLVRFLASCPVLEVLYVKRNKNDNVKNFNVKVPSLQYLHYTNVNNNRSLDIGRCLAIDTPALIDFQIADYSRDSWSIENMPCLEDAYIDVKSFPDIDKSKTSISAVLSLVLFMTDEVLVRCTTINFSRLIKLSIHPHESEWLEPLSLLLGNVPKLKDLLVTYEYTLIPVDRIPLSWTQPSSIPGCLSSQLEIFEYIGYGFRDEEEEFLTYIQAHSKCLKTVTISVNPSFDLEEQEFIIDDLKDIPRVSTTSQLLFRKVS